MMKQQKRFKIFGYQKGCGAWGGATATTTRLAHMRAGADFLFENRKLA